MRITLGEEGPMVVAPASRRVGVSTVVSLGVAINALAALAVGGLHLLGAAPPLRSVSWPGALALTVAYALPAALAGIALASRRPAGLLAAGLLGLPLAFTAMSGASLVLLVPAAMFLGGYASWRPRPRLQAGPAAALAVIVVAGVAPLVLPFASPLGHSTGYCYAWTDDAAGRRSYGPASPATLAGAAEESGSGGGPAVAARGRGCTSDVVTIAEAALGLAAAALTLSLGLPRATIPRPAGDGRRR
jgi:hypothetical protein